MRHTVLTSFEHLPYFTIEGFRQFVGDQVMDGAHARVMIHRWVKAGRLNERDDR